MALERPRNPVGDHLLRPRNPLLFFVVCFLSSRKENNISPVFGGKNAVDSKSYGFHQYGKEEGQLKTWLELGPQQKTNAWVLENKGTQKSKNKTRKELILKKSTLGTCALVREIAPLCGELRPLFGRNLAVRGGEGFWGFDLFSRLPIGHIESKNHPPPFKAIEPNHLKLPGTPYGCFFEVIRF